jgi:hypothetical protein
MKLKLLFSLIVGIIVVGVVGTTTAAAFDHHPTPSGNYGFCVKNGSVTPGKNGTLGGGPDGHWGPWSQKSAQNEAGTQNPFWDGKLPFIGLIYCSK